MSPRPLTREPLLVLTATLGRSPWLAAAVASVRQRVGDMMTHLLVAPGREVAALRREHPHCRVVPEAGGAGGLYAALNAGLRAAEDWPWRWMTFLADDDLLLPGFRALYAAAAGTERGGEAVIWRGAVIVIDTQGRRRCCVPHVRRASDVAALVAAGVSPFNQQGMLYSRAAVARTGPFDTSMRICADAEHWLRALENGVRVRRLGVPVAAFRVRAGQLSAQIAAHREEYASLRERARRLHGRRPLWPAVLRFRLANLALYAERVGRVGFVTGFGLLQRP